MAHAAYVEIPGDDAERLSSTPPAEASPDGFSVRHRGQTLHVPNTDVRIIEARGNYALLYTAGAKYMIRDTMSALEARLVGRGFLRVHRSAIVNLAFLKGVVPRGSGDHVAVLVDGTRLRFGRMYYARLRQQRR